MALPRAAYLGRPFFCQFFQEGNMNQIPEEKRWQFLANDLRETAVLPQIDAITAARARVMALRIQRRVHNNYNNYLNSVCPYCKKVHTGYCHQARNQ